MLRCQHHSNLSYKEERQHVHHEGALVRRARAGQLFGLLLIPTTVSGVDSTPRMGGWVGWWMVGWGNLG